MTKLEITLEIILNSLMLSFIAAMVRVMFSNLTNFSDTLKIFVGSILFGSIVGYTINDFDAFKPYLKIAVIISSIFGKELFLWLEKIINDPIKNLGIILKTVGLIKGIKIDISNDSKTKKDDN